MALLDKKLYLADLETRLNDFIPSNDVRRIIEQAADALAGYDIKNMPEAIRGSTDSENLVKLFLDAKGVKTDAYRIKKKAMLYKYGVKIREV